MRGLPAQWFNSRASATSGDNTRLVLVNLENLGADYARTLEAWRLRFLERGDAVAQLGFDVQFKRLWEFYLAYCEAGFRERSSSDVQMLFTKSPDRRIPWRAHR
jgi:cyclopropane-fatty-acyl-phospholipid synthase